METPELSRCALSIVEPAGTSFAVVGGEQAEALRTSARTCRNQLAFTYPNDLERILECTCSLAHAPDHNRSTKRDNTKG
jgi:hypothetical protein